MNEKAETKTDDPWRDMRFCRCGQIVRQIAGGRLADVDVRTEIGVMLSGDHVCSNARARAELVEPEPPKIWRAKLPPELREKDGSSTVPWGRVLLVAHSPEQGQDEHPPLEGRPLARLAELANTNVVPFKLAAFRASLFPVWPGPELARSIEPSTYARAAALLLWRDMPERPTIFVGRVVARAFDMGELPFFRWYDVRVGTPGAMPTRRVAVIPYPSGRNKLTRDDMWRCRAGEFLKRAVQA